MVRAIDLVSTGLTKRAIYYRIAKLGYGGDPEYPMTLTKEQAHRVIHYKPRRRGRKAAKA